VAFADSSGFIAAFDPRDAAHAEVAAAWRQIAKARERLITTQLVLAETVTYLRRRGGWEQSRRAGAAILDSPLIEVIALDAEQLAASWREFVRLPDPKLSLCDAASFIVMRDRHVQRALTLDRHFRDAGFELVPWGPRA
jgi:predicted nucleic acid-binding protein